MKFSIIVPVYNVESYLRKCMDSLVRQNLTLEEYEIIMINDGSTDKCSEILTEYKNKYANIILLEQKNRGQSAARNRGLSVARGKYLVFVDSDDYLEENMLPSLYEKLERECLDVLAVKNDFVDNSGEKIKKIEKNFFESQQIISGEDYILQNGISMMVTVWSYVYSRSFVLKHNLCFADGLYHEDCLWTVQWLPYAKRIGSVDEVFYHYRYSAMSTMRSRKLKKSSDLLLIAYQIYCCAENYQQEFGKKISAPVYKYAAFEVYSSIRSCVQQGYQLRQLIDSDDKRRKMLKLLKKSYKCGVFWIFLKFHWDVGLQFIMKIWILLHYKAKK